MAEFRYTYQESDDVGYQAERFKAWLQTQASPKLSPVEVAKLVLDVGWTGEDAVLAVAVCGAESGFRVRGKNVAKNGTFDAGLFQVNSIHGHFENELYIPAINAQAAFALYKRRGFQPWVAFKNNKHLAFMDLARRAIAEAQAPSQSSG